MSALTLCIFRITLRALINNVIRFGVSRVSLEICPLGSIQMAIL